MSSARPHRPPEAVPSSSDPAVEAFIARWSASGGGERSNAQAFLLELCDLLDVPRPDGSVEDESRNGYVFERKVRVPHDDKRATPNFIDLYKRGCFVLEAKQSAKRQQQRRELAQLGLDLIEQRAGSGRRGGAQWDALMRNARQQAENYAKYLPQEDGWPPFLVVVDVGHVIELYADFSLQGKHYAQFPDRQTYRLYLEDLREAEVRERLRLVWQDPHALNPARRTAQVTREIAELLALLSKSLESRLTAHPRSDTSAEAQADRAAVAERVAMFLMRCLFTMFAEDVDLLKRDAFTGLLTEYRGMANKLHLALQQLWEHMDGGGFSPLLKADVLRFNGGLFKDAVALEVTEEELNWLLIAAGRQWKDVEPAIFGTLLERALDRRDRSALGAHYTPRAYVERLVVATVIEPLTEDWRNVQAAAALEFASGDAERARETVKTFHRRLCDTRVLDPACGTGNFLYVALELMKRLEGEVLETLTDMGETQWTLDLDRHTVDPHQFLGLEINPRAVAIAELVLWIGYLQWHFRTRGRTLPAQPVLKNFKTIQGRDAVIDYDGWDLVRDEHGRPLSRWDGVTHTLHPITGEEVPDETARRELRTYRKPRPASWPTAEFIVGNPPFIGGKDMRQELGDGYAEACWAARPYLPGGADFVMHFWDKAAETVRLGKARRFGFITTNSITQAFSRKVIARHLEDRKPLSLAFAVPDHPWIKGRDRAAVRIAMTVGVAGNRSGVLHHVVREEALDTDAPLVDLESRAGRIWSDLTIGANLNSAKALRANDGLCSPGVKLHGAGFIVEPRKALALGLGTVPGLEDHILDYRNGRDLTARPRGVKVIDLYPLSEDDVRQRFPAVYQHVFDHVRGHREAQRGRTADATQYAENWWLFGKPRQELRKALQGLARYIATVETSKHRFFQFLDHSIRPDNMVIAFGLDDAFYLGVLSSRIHIAWALAAGGRLGVGNDPRYNKTRCFDPFPFPDAPVPLKTRIRDLAEDLDAHRKDVLDRHPQLTMTKLYNVLDLVRAGTALSAAEKDVYDAGLVGVLRSLHDGIDAAVAEAYGWPVDLPDAEILDRLVALNQRRASEEADGLVRWLRPEYQAAQSGTAAKGRQLEAVLTPDAAATKKPKFPAALPEQVAMLRDTLDHQQAPMTPLTLARGFSQGKKAEKRIAELLDTLTLLGQVERVGDAYVLS